MIYYLFALLVVVVTVYILKSLCKPKKFPPGPKWYPFMGSSGVLSKLTKKHGSQWKAFTVLANEYSTQVLGLKLGTELVVVVYGENNIRQVFTGSEFEGRPNSFFIRLRCLGKRMGITFSDGPLWREHRQFTVKQLRNVGFGKTAMESEIQNEMQNIVDAWKKNTGKPISPKETIAKAVMNVLWKYVAGEHIDEERLTFLLELLNARSRAFSMTGGWLNQFPWSRFILPNISGYNLIKNMNQQITEIIQEAIQRHKNRAVGGNDFIYSFLKEVDENKNTFTEDQLTTICLDLLIAGSTTTSNLLGFALLNVLRNKMIQDKIYDEITKLLGDEVPSWADSTRLVYTSAFILEVQRYYNIVPLAGPRRVLRESVIDGYVIPKDTTVLLALGDLHVDPKIWENPHEFKPERFIDNQGNLKHPEHLYTFGLGRRRCPGDALAKSFIFLIFVGIIQKFKIECSNGVLPCDDPIIGIISSPRPYTAEFIPRN